MKRIDATIFVPEFLFFPTIYVDDNATNEDIRQAIIKEIIEQIDFEYTIREVKE